MTERDPARLRDEIAHELARALVAQVRADLARDAAAAPPTPGAAATSSRWLTVKEAAAYAQVGPRLVYREVRAKRLRAAVVGGRRELRFREAWIDQWLDDAAARPTSPSGRAR